MRRLYNSLVSMSSPCDNPPCCEDIVAGKIRASLKASRISEEGSKGKQNRGMGIGRRYIEARFGGVESENGSLHPNSLPIGGLKGSNQKTEAKSNSVHTCKWMRRGNNEWGSEGMADTYAVFMSVQPQRPKMAGREREREIFIWRRTCPAPRVWAKGGWHCRVVCHLAKSRKCNKISLSYVFHHHHHHHHHLSAACRSVCRGWSMYICMSTVQVGRRLFYVCYQIISEVYHTYTVVNFIHCGPK